MFTFVIDDVSEGGAKVFFGIRDSFHTTIRACSIPVQTKTCVSCSMTPLFLLLGGSIHIIVLCIVIMLSKQIETNHNTDPLEQVYDLDPPDQTAQKR